MDNDYSSDDVTSLLDKASPYVVLATITFGGGFVVLDPYDAIGHGFPIIIRAVVFFGVVLPLGVAAAFAMSRLTVARLLAVYGALAAIVALWSIGLNAAFKGVYGGRVNLFDAVVGAALAIVAVSPIAGAQCLYLIFFRRYFPEKKSEDVSRFRQGNSSGAEEAKETLLDTDP